MFLPSYTRTKAETVCSTAQEQDKPATLASHPTDTKVQPSSLPLTFMALASYPTVTTIPSDRLAFHPVHTKSVLPKDQRVRTHEITLSTFSHIPLCSTTLAAYTLPGLWCNIYFKFW